MKHKLLKVLSAAATLFALAAVSSASWVFAYQPKEPKCLKK